MTNDKITELALAHGFKLKEQPGGAMALNPYVFDFARALLAAPGVQSVDVDFKQVTQILEMFGGEPAEMTICRGEGHSGMGVYASYTDMPDEGAEYLGESDDEATPEPVAQPAAPAVMGWRDAAYKDSTPRLHVGNSSFEDWYQAHPKACTGDKQLARDSYAAGMGDPLVTYAVAL